MDKDFEQALSLARAEMDLGNYKAAGAILRSLVELKVPEAMFLYSTFSMDEGEQDQEFEQRSARLLLESSALGYPPAMYALASCYESGDLVDLDPKMALKWYGRAAAAGYPRALFRYGMALFSGEVVPADKVAGREMVRRAAEAGLEDATEALREMN